MSSKYWQRLWLLKCATMKKKMQINELNPRARENGNLIDQWEKLKSFYLLCIQACQPRLPVLFLEDYKRSPKFIEGNTLCTSLQRYSSHLRWCMEGRGFQCFADYFGFCSSVFAASKRNVGTLLAGETQSSLLSGCSRIQTHARIQSTVIVVARLVRLGK